MPSFHEETVADAPPEEVWKLLYDPGRFPEWWVGIETVDQAAPAAGGGASTYTAYPAGYPDFPLPQEISTARDRHRVVISCLVSYLRYTWTIEPAGLGTAVRVHVSIPEAESHRLPAQVSAMRGSLRRLAELAASAT